MVLHKELRVLAENTPCIIRTSSGGYPYSDTAKNILTRITGIKSPLKDSFVKRVDLVTKDSKDYYRYSFSYESFLLITVKLKEGKVNENQG